jgi:transposase
MEKKLTIIHPNAAGIDIGAEEVFVAIDGHQVQSYKTFTRNFQELVSNLLKHQVATVAMEATGVYWFALYEMLEGVGIEVFLVNGAHTRNVPGRKSDVKDCQWLMQLHTYGLLRKSFIPDESIRQLRTYVRLRDDHISMGNSHILHMQKALTSMNIRLHQVISRIVGVSGMRILRAILSGERNAERLAMLCEKQILNKKYPEVVLSLEGQCKEEHLFALQQAIEGYEFYQRQRQRCEERIEELMRSICEQLPPPDCPTLLNAKLGKLNRPQIEQLHPMLVTMTGGKDAATIPGLSDLSFLKLVSEVGTDMSKWPTEKHFTSWAGLSPRKDQSGSRVKRRKSAKTVAGQIFREAAQSMAKSKNIALGGFYRRIRAKRGAPVAVMATARKLAVQFYNLMKHGATFVEKGIEDYEKKYKENMEKRLRKTAQSLGFSLIPTHC